MEKGNHPISEIKSISHVMISVLHSTSSPLSASITPSFFHSTPGSEPTSSTNPFHYRFLYPSDCLLQTLYLFLFAQWFLILVTFIVFVLFSVLSRLFMHKRVTSCRSASVQLSVCHIRAFHRDGKIIKLIFRTGSPIILFFSEIIRRYIIPKGTHSARSCIHRVGTIRNFRPMSRYILGTV